MWKVPLFCSRSRTTFFYTIGVLVFVEDSNLKRAKPSRFSSASTHLSTHSGLDFKKMRRDKVRRLSFVDTLCDNTPDSEMPCVQSDDEEDEYHPCCTKSKRIKLPTKVNLQFFDDFQKVDHSSVPRKLRSGSLSVFTLSVFFTNFFSQIYLMLENSRKGKYWIFGSATRGTGSKHNGHLEICKLPELLFYLHYCAGINCLAILKSPVPDGNDCLFTGSRDGT
ncbi:hypothetical protein POM88_001132 [Heracleum sosnowskyi]|uniref:Uncharacterized protein n=1 Tax=Heracleum sosnowskyi TaxID=360622 RepID=A0AAD8JBX9_9APIA|nr:hypothetical protein POM88_001132 [Heracleum sosnowskyi]